MQTKLDTFKQRNKRVNAALYLPTAVEGVDFVKCPVSGARMRLIKSSYITNVLGMSVEEYNTTYPSIQKVCTDRVAKIKMSLHTVDPNVGITKHQLSSIKAKASSSKIGGDGLTRYQRSANKTRDTHLNNIDEHGRNGYQRQAYFRKTTILSNGLSVEQNAHIKQKVACAKNHKAGNSGASKISKVVLYPILQLLILSNIKYYFDENEYGVYDISNQQHYFFDLVIPELQMAIEYQSNAWHADPTLSEAEWNSWTPVKGIKKSAQSVLEYDYNKAKVLYGERGYVTYYIWENSKQQDVEDILCLVQMKIMKS